MSASRPSHEPDLSGLLRAADAAMPDAANQLFALLYGELHELAERQLRRGSEGATLGTTSLLHDLYLDIADRPGIANLDRSRFMAYAARAMRGLIIDRYRSRRAVKRGAEFHFVGGELPEVPAEEPTTDLEALGEALDSLASVDASLAELVDLHFFAGYSLVEVAHMRGVSDRTVQRDWRKARLLLFHAMGGSKPS